MRKRRDSAELDAERTAATWEMAETAAARERLRGLFSDLGELPERQRAALVMRELGGLGFEEIGDAFETTPAVARQTLYEARQSLRQMEEGREMSCETVTRALSDADGRVTRRRDLRAHLRSCADCRAFRDGIAARSEELTAIAPLPLAVSAGLLHSILGGQAGAASVAASVGAGAGGIGGLAGTVGAGAGKVVATSAVVKSAATVAVVAAVGVGAADRGGAIDLPLTGGEGKATKGVSKPGSSFAPNRGEAGIESRASAGASPMEAAGANGKAPQSGARSKGAVDSSRFGARKGRPAHAGRPNRSRSAGSRSRGHSGRGKEGPPPTADRRQGTAAERRSPQANSAPGGGGEPSAKAAPMAQPAKPTKPESAPPPQTSKPVPMEPSPATAPSATPNAGSAAQDAGSGTIEAPEP